MIDVKHQYHYHGFTIYENRRGGFGVFGSTVAAGSLEAIKRCVDTYLAACPLSKQQKPLYKTFKSKMNSK